MLPLPPRPHRTDTLFPYTTLVRSVFQVQPHRAALAEPVVLEDPVGMLPSLIVIEGELVNPPTLLGSTPRGLGGPRLEAHSGVADVDEEAEVGQDRKSTRLNSSH